MSDVTLRRTSVRVTDPEVYVRLTHRPKTYRIDVVGSEHVLVLSSADGMVETHYRIVDSSTADDSGGDITPRFLVEEL